MIFAMWSSICRIIRFLETLIASMPSFLRVTLSWCRFAGYLGTLLSLMEIIFFLYWTKIWLQRVPSYDHDFLGVWLTICNLIIAAYLAILQAYSQAEWAKDEDNNLRLRFVTSLYVFH